jgi:hypothetical protein
MELTYNSKRKYVWGGGRGGVRERFSNVNPQGRKETAGQKQKNEGTAKIERIEDLFVL